MRLIAHDAANYALFEPALIFLGVIISGLIAYCGLTMLNGSFAFDIDVLDGVPTASELSPKMILVMLGLVTYGYVAFLVLVQSYAIIGLLPDKISTWLGSGPLSSDNVFQQVMGIRSGVEFQLSLDKELVNLGRDKEHQTKGRNGK